MKHINLIIFAVILISGCKKDFLAAKQNQNKIIPEQISDYQALLDDATRTINRASSQELGIIAGDEYVLSDAAWNSLPSNASPYERKGYYWAKENVYEQQPVRDWNYGYQKVLYANTALDGLAAMNSAAEQQEGYANVKGSALFLRALVFYQLLQEFAPQYDPNTAKNDLGVPLRLTSAISQKVGRGSVEGSYQQIITDLKTAEELLPLTAINKYRPSKLAVDALLAKIYLQLFDYSQARVYAEKCLAGGLNLMDYNTFNVTSDYALPVNINQNTEVIYNTYILNISVLQTSRAVVAPNLLALYENGDLTKDAYFSKNADGTFYFKGSYSGAISPCFTGLAFDEVLLIQAECEIRLGTLSKANDLLNILRKNRFSKANYTAVSFTDQESALGYVLDERRRRLVLRGVRWSDLRRLNKEGKFITNLSRTLNGVNYVLPAGDLRYTWPLPDEVISLGGYEQNIR